MGCGIFVEDGDDLYGLLLGKFEKGELIVVKIFLILINFVVILGKF